MVIKGLSVTGTSIVGIVDYAKGHEVRAEEIAGLLKHLNPDLNENEAIPAIENSLEKAFKENKINKVQNGIYKSKIYNLADYL